MEQGGPEILYLHLFSISIEFFSSLPVFSFKFNFQQHSLDRRKEIIGKRKKERIGEIEENNYFSRIVKIGTDYNKFPLFPKGIILYSEI